MCNLQILKCDKKCDQQSVILQALTSQSHFSASQKHKRNFKSQVTVRECDILRKWDKGVVLL